MVPNTNCNLVVDHTTDLLNCTLPKPLHNAGKECVVLLNERLRKAMMYLRAPAPYYKTISTIFTIFTP